MINRPLGVGRKLLLVSTAPALTVVGHQLWMNATHNITWAMQFVTANSGLSWLLNVEAIWPIALRFAWTLLYLGLFTLPLFSAVWLARRPQNQHPFDVRWRKFFGLWLIVLVLPVVAVVAATRHSMPFLSNIINQGGLGALTLLGLRQPQLPMWLFWLITIGAPIAGAAYAATWTQIGLTFRRLSTSELVMLLTGLGVGGMSLIFVVFWDRYLLALLPVSIYLVLRGRPINRVGWIGGVALCGVVAIFSLIGLRDYFMWNEVRWSTAQHLVEQGVPPTAIDGGVEWVGWYDFEAALAQARSAGRADTILGWMAATPKLYWLAFEPLAGYKVVDEVAYPRPFSDQPDRIYVLQRP